MVGHVSRGNILMGLLSSWVLFDMIELMSHIGWLVVDRGRYTVVIRLRKASSRFPTAHIDWANLGQVTP